MKKNNLEKYLSDQAQDMETMPRKLVWEALSKQLDGVAQQQDVVNNPKAKKVAHKAPLRKWALAAMVAGLLLSPFVWNLRTTPTDTVNERSRTTPAAIVNTHSTTPTIGVTGATIKAPSLVVSNSAQQLILEQGIDHSTATKVVAKKTLSTSSADLRLAQEQTLSSVLPNMHDPSDVEEGLAVVLSPEMDEYAPFKNIHFGGTVSPFSNLIRYFSFSAEQVIIAPFSPNCFFANSFRLSSHGALSSSFKGFPAFIFATFSTG